MLELLAPAGSMEALRAAVQNGANAVYLGCGAFNARQSAKNFTPQTLTEAVKYCHIRGVAVHLTLNTLVSDREAAEAIELIRQAAGAGVDAFIVQDLGILRLCRQIAPHIPIHGSTQMTVHSLPGVLLCAAWGMRRVVLSRELSREQIAFICQNSPIEIEVFAHGALCMSYSGQCYLSAAIGGRSGNRGRCAQPCRQSYGFGRWEDKYPLSLKDNCLVEHLQELREMGVASLKLEGRMKRPEYVATVTRVYRMALDSATVTPAMRKALHTAFNRQGFTDGYYTGSIGPGMFGVRQDTRDDPQWLKDAQQSYETGEAGLVPLKMQMVVTHQGSQLSVTDPQGRVCSVYGPMPEPARTRELTGADLSSRLEKTGGTPYTCEEAQIHVEPGLMLSAAAINAMRRDVLNQLTALRARTEQPRPGRPERLPRTAGHRSAPGLTAQVTAREQVTNRLLQVGLKLLYVPLHLLAQDPAWAMNLRSRVPVCAVLPRIVRDEQVPRLKQQLRMLRGIGITEALASNPGQLLTVRECGLGIRGDFGLNIYNSYAMETVKELELRSVCLSFELTLPQIRDISKSVDTELLMYGRLPLMLTENCVHKNRTGECTCHLTQPKLVDKTGAEFPVIKDADSCRSVVLNGKKLNWLDRQDDLSRLGLWATRMYFTTENPKEVDQVLANCLDPQPFDPGSCTRGLYLRGLE